MDQQRRVGISGIGIISALGPDREAFTQRLKEGHSGIVELNLFDTTAFRSRWGGQAPEPKLPPPGRNGSRSPHYSRADRLALHAAAEALADARLSINELRHTAIVLGTGAGGINFTIRYEAKLKTCGEAKTPANWLVSHQPANVTDLLANHWGLNGPRLSLMTACSSSATAIGLGMDMIRLGRAQRVMVGGAEGLSPYTFGGFSALRAMDEVPCRPFHNQRNGLTLGEGAAILILEDLSLAEARGIEPYAEVAGYGVSADAYHLTAPAPDGRGAIMAMQAALTDAGLEPMQVDYLNAHGTATRHNDPIEITAIRAVFGAQAECLAISSTKAMTGHTLGAAGAIEAVVCAIAIRENFIPPTLRLDCPDPQCDLDLVPHTSRPAHLSAVLSNSFAFGGNNTSLVLRR